VLTQENGNVAYEGDVGHDAADDVFALEVVLASGVELRVVCEVVVAFCEEFCFFSVVSKWISRCPFPLIGIVIP